MPIYFMYDFVCKARDELCECICTSISVFEWLQDWKMISDVVSHPALWPKLFSTSARRIEILSVRVCAAYARTYPHLYVHCISRCYFLSCRQVYAFISFIQGIDIFLYRHVTLWICEECWNRENIFLEIQTHNASKVGHFHTRTL